jgi:hypothetical protein
MAVVLNGKASKLADVPVVPKNTYWARLVFSVWEHMKLPAQPGQLDDLIHEWIDLKRMALITDPKRLQWLEVVPDKLYVIPSYTDDCAKTGDCVKFLTGPLDGGWTGPDRTCSIIVTDFTIYRLRQYRNLLLHRNHQLDLVDQELELRHKIYDILDDAGITLPTEKHRRSDGTDWS